MYIYKMYKFQQKAFDDLNFNKILMTNMIFFQFKIALLL